MLAAVIAVAVLNVGVYWGIWGKPVFDGTSMHRLDCADIIRYEDGSVVCEVHLREADEELVIYRRA